MTPRTTPHEDGPAKRKVSASRRAATYLREQILNGTLRPGSRLAQEAVAKDLEMSRIPVREALRQLESEGLLILASHGRARVPRLDFDEYTELYKIREYLEPLAAGEAATRITDGELDELGHLLHEMERTTEPGAWLELDRRFHLASYMPSRMPRLMRSVESFWNVTQPYRRVFMSTLAPAEAGITRSEHVLLFDALRRHDAVEAEQMIRSHIRRTRLRLAERRELFEQSPELGPGAIERNQQRRSEMTTATIEATPQWADFPTAEHQERVTRAQRSMKKHGIDLLLLTQRENIQYFSGLLCGHWTSKTFATGILLIHVTKDPVLVIPDFFAGTARGSSWVSQHMYYEEPHARPRGSADVVVEAVKKVAGASAVIGLESGQNLVDGWNLADYDVVRGALTSATFKSAAEVIWDCRMIKSRREVERLREITRITEKAMVEARDKLHAGMTEQDLARATAAAGFLHGAEGIAFTNIRSGIDRYPMADSTPTSRPIRGGEMVVFDIGLTLRTYTSDIAYNTLIGAPTPKHAEVWQHIVMSQDAALAAMRPGVKAKDVFRACNKVLADYGFGKLIDMVGHGIGLDVHEPPILAPYDDRVLEAGMVFAVEPWVYDIKGLGVFALEEMVAVTEDGFELLSSLPRNEIWHTAG